MGVERAEDRQHQGMAVIGAGGPGIKVRYADLPLDVFGQGGGFLGLAFDGELFLLDEMTSVIEAYVRENWENPDLVADPCFTADRRLAGFHIRLLGGGQ